ncbi:ABC transporter permease [Kosmotoga arenicorallina S304]|uniref:ABC transporter permease n=1 Tax=Kosmotoga arenicorallina S304 TaxID=1453497 RepID=A0A176JZK2_9BACT|nr:iron ABC transporter permease [Kosmotoga arenicorallina]OAA29439.1 ABC transporter permease [Kosmotoga arenicorallina S304]
MAKLLNRIVAFFQKPENVILVMLLLALVYLTIVPLFSIAFDTFTVHSSEVRRIRGSSAGDFTFYHWNYVFNSRSSKNLFYKPLLNTTLVALAVCGFSLLTGGFFAWMVTRTNLKYKKAISTLMLFPYIMPSWTLAMAWINFFKNSSIGGAPGLFSALTGITTPDWVAYGFFPIVMTLGMHYAPFAFILIGGILRNMDANLEEAAVILKASRMRIMRKITFPIVMPAVLSTFLLVFSSSMSAFAVPAFLGGPVRFQVLTTQLFRTLNGVNPGAGYIIASVMIIIGTLILTINQIIIGRRKGFTTVTGKSSNISLVNLGKLRTFISALMLLTLIGISIIPLMTFAFQSFLVEPGNYSLSNFSTIFWVGEGRPDIASGEPGILKNKYIYKGLVNSFTLSLTVAFIAGTVGMLVGYAVAKKRGTKASNMLDRLAFFPYLIPSMAFGAIYLSMFSVRRGIIPALYGTFAILVVVGSVKYLPFASRAGINAILQLGREIEEAAIIFGVKWWKRMLRIIIPIQKPTFISGYSLPFISSMRELSLYILLVTPSTSLLTTMLFQYNEKGWDQYANAIVLLIISIVLIFNLLINKITGSSIDKGIGG